jgi:hypothetical protein
MCKFYLYKVVKKKSWNPYFCKWNLKSWTSYYLLGLAPLFMWLKLLKPFEWIPYLTHKALMVGHLKLGKLVVKFNYHYVFSIKVELGPFPCYLGLATHLHVCQSFHTEKSRIHKISSKYLGQQNQNHCCQ